uniref:CCAAT-binding factor domain-containing protein n=1 Tax=Megaselia scalaris TaxID=36166 RepID=T1GKH2_MEGSC
MQDTIYRLVHLADIRISIQTLSLLLQLVGKKSVKSDRFYNALYKKMLDLNLTNIGAVTAANFLHILHKAIYIDSNIPRCLAFIKRLLQLALYVPAHVAAGCLIIINKLFKSRRELVKTLDEPETTIAPVEVDLSKFDDDSDGEEIYKDVDDEKNNVDSTKKEKVSSSWHHVKVQSVEVPESNVKEIAGNKYDPYHRVPAFAGADNSLRAELLLLCQHFHPTVQVFAESVLNQKKISYYGDPLKDFSLAHFLERFVFKNPKKNEKSLSEVPQTVQHKNYISYGSRGKSVKSLTRTNCTEDEKFIFNIWKRNA